MLNMRDLVILKWWNWRIQTNWIRQVLTFWKVYQLFWKCFTIDDIGELNCFGSIGNKIIHINDGLIISFWKLYRKSAAQKIVAKCTKFEIFNIVRRKSALLNMIIFKLWNWRGSWIYDLHASSLCTCSKVIGNAESQYFYCHLMEINPKLPLNVLIIGVSNKYQWGLQWFLTTSSCKFVEVLYQYGNTHKWILPITYMCMLEETIWWYASVYLGNCVKKCVWDLCAEQSSLSMIIMPSLDTWPRGNYRLC